MHIELTADQSRALSGQNGSVVVIDPVTRREYHLIPAAKSDGLNEIVAAALPEIPPGVRASREALWRDLPELLKVKKNHGQCVCYHGNRRIGIGIESNLVRICQELGLKDHEYYIGIVEEAEFIEVEEVESFRPDLVEDRDNETPCP